MSGDRGYRDLDVISYGTAAEQRKKVQRSGSIRTNNARKSNLGNHGGVVRNGNDHRSNIRTIHTKSSDIRNQNVRSNAARSNAARSNGARNNGVKSNSTRNNNVRSNYVRQMQKPYNVRESSQAQKRKRHRRQTFIARFACAFSICVVAGLAGVCMYKLLFPTEHVEEHKSEGLAAFAENVFQKEEGQTIEDIFTALRIEGISCTQDFLTVNEYSRPGDKLKKVNNIFVHYTANPATSAAQNRSYFENLATTHETSASAHFIIGYEGELVQCIPLEEIAYAVATRNEDSISIECCYLDEDGKFTKETYTTLVHFTARLLKKYGLEAEDLRRHYDEGGKACPKYYVENEEEWWKFIQDVKTYQDSL